MSGAKQGRVVTASMLAQAIVAYLHYLSILITFAAIVAQHLLIKPDTSGASWIRIARLDAVYGVGALAILVTGFLRFFYYGKGWAYYLTNPVFHLKLTLFIIVAILSVYPSVVFFKTARAYKRGAEPTAPPRVKRLQMILRAELTLFLLIPLAAALMARGIGS